MTHLPDELDQLGGCAGFADDLEARAAQQARQSFAEENVVVGKHDPRAACAHGMDYGVT